MYCHELVSPSSHPQMLSKSGDIQTDLEPFRNSLSETVSCMSFWTCQFRPKISKFCPICPWASKKIGYTLYNGFRKSIPLQIYQILDHPIRTTFGRETQQVKKHIVMYKHMLPYFCFVGAEL